MSIEKSNPRRKKYLFFVLPVNEPFACWHRFQFGFGVGARSAYQIPFFPPRVDIHVLKVKIKKIIARSVPFTWRSFLESVFIQ